MVFIENIRNPVEARNGGLQMCIRDSITSEDGFSDDLNNAIQTFSVKANELIAARSGQYPHYDYTRADVDDLIALLKEIYLKAGGRDVYKRQNDNRFLRSDRFHRSRYASCHKNAFPK